MDTPEDTPTTLSGQAPVAPPDGEREPGRPGASPAASMRLIPSLDQQGPAGLEETVRAAPSPRRVMIQIILCGLLLLCTPLTVALLVQYDYLKDLEQVSDERLTLYKSTLSSALHKYKYLPFLISKSVLVKQLLTEGNNVDEVNRFLEDANNKSGAAAVYIINSNGIVLAASNWRIKENYIGLDLAFRPYFMDPMNGKEGDFYGIGITTGEPGYYISHPIVVDGEILGVAATKIALSPLEAIWQEGGETVFVSDSNGVIVLSSRPLWKYRTLSPLSAEKQREIYENGQYSAFRLEWLPSRSRSLGLLNEVTIGDEHFLMTTSAIAGLDWKMSYLMHVDALRERMLGSSLTSFILVGLGISLMLFRRERKQKEISRRQARDAEKFREINKQLAKEVDEHKRTELELREAQEELVQAGKLAALGEMATAVAHELNQPIAATKTYVASCKLMVSRNKMTELEPTLNKISELSDRMGKVTSQLKAFARKSTNIQKEFDLRQAIDESLTLMQHQFEVVACGLSLTMPQEPVRVVGDRVRFEQILINLFRNSLDSMQGENGQTIGVHVEVEDEARITVWDSGPGIAPDIASRLFEPFVTSKKEGVGLGLGLYISHKIIRDMGGTISAANRPGQGAEFIMTLPLTHPDKEYAHA